MKTNLSTLNKLYETEYDQWIEEMVKRLKNRQLDGLDYDNLIEELEALGRSEKSAVKNLVLQIIIHLLQYQYWESEKERNANHWAGEIITFRVQLEDRLTTNLRYYLVEELPTIYQKARLIFQKKTNFSSLLEECPYSLEQLLDENWFPNE